MPNVYRPDHDEVNAEIRDALTGTAFESINAEGARLVAGIVLKAIENAVPQERDFDDAVDQVRSTRTTEIAREARSIIEPSERCWSDEVTRLDNEETLAHADDVFAVRYADEDGTNRYYIHKVDAATGKRRGRWTDDIQQATLFDSHEAAGPGLDGAFAVYDLDRGRLAIVQVK